MTGMSDFLYIKKLPCVILNPREQHERDFMAVFTDLGQDIFGAESMFPFTRVNLDDCVRGVEAVEFDLGLNGVLELYEEFHSKQAYKNAYVVRWKSLPFHQYLDPSTSFIWAIERHHQKVEICSERIHQSDLLNARTNKGGRMRDHGIVDCDPRA